MVLHGIVSSRKKTYPVLADDLMQMVLGICRDLGWMQRSMVFQNSALKMIRSVEKETLAVEKVGLSLLQRLPSDAFAEFFQGITGKSPVYLPGTTPSYSNAGFQILAYALEGITGKKYQEILNKSILKPLHMNQTSLATPPDSNIGVILGDTNSTGWAINYGEDPAISMYSNLRDLAVAGTSIISSSLLSSSSTRRWLKPISATSNRANTQGRPWEIYNAVLYKNAPVTEVYTVIGNIGHYSSYIGLVPNYGVGFVMLAADSEGSADLNAYVDFIFAAMTPALEKAAVVQANASYSGMYTSSNGTRMKIEVDGKPGLVVTELTNNGADVRAGIAKLKGIELDALIFRLYPSNVQSGSRMEFRAIWQDNNDLADGGTPTCVSWMDIEDLVYGGESLDRYVFELDESGSAKSVEIPALRAALGKN